MCLRDGQKCVTSGALLDVHGGCANQQMVEWHKLKSAET